jgi:hypothetical protein
MRQQDGREIGDEKASLGLLDFRISTSNRRGESYRFDSRHQR